MDAESQLAAFKHGVAGRYLIDQEIGRGGMAAVYLARDIRLGRRVAIKVLDPAIASPRTVTAFRRELSHTVRLEHPNVLPLLDAGEAEGLPFYAMRYVRGGSLRQRLAGCGRLAPRHALATIRQLAAALQYAHDHQILHGDVKPENILLEGEHVYLADFGISRAVLTDAFPAARRRAEGGGQGTAGYVSPEQALGQRSLDGRADLYSLACVVSEMLGGRPPFTGENDRDVVARRFIAPADLDTLAGVVPDGVRREISRALSLDPDDRQRSVREFASALEKGLGHGPRHSGRAPGGLRDTFRRAVAMLAAGVAP